MAHLDLENMRAIGDHPANEAIARWKDETIARCKEEKDKQEKLTRLLLKDLADNLVGFDEAPELPELLEFLRQADELPQLVGCLRQTDDEVKTDNEAKLNTLHELALAEDLFTDHGLKILMILVFYSLPAAYAARLGVQGAAL